MSRLIRIFFWYQIRYNWLVVIASIFCNLISRQKINDANIRAVIICGFFILVIFFFLSFDQLSVLFKKLHSFVDTLYAAL